MTEIKKNSKTKQLLLKIKQKLFQINKTETELMGQLQKRQAQKKANDILKDI